MGHLSQRQADETSSIQTRRRGHTACASMATISIAPDTITNSAVRSPPSLTRAVSLHACSQSHQMSVFHLVAGTVARTFAVAVRLDTNYYKLL